MAKFFINVTLANVAEKHGSSYKVVSVFAIGKYKKREFAKCLDNMTDGEMKVLDIAYKHIECIGASDETLSDVVKRALEAENFSFDYEVIPDNLSEDIAEDEEPNK